MTRARWLDIGQPANAAKAAAAVNRDMQLPIRDWARPGRLVGDMDAAADTTWAEVNLELYQPWLLNGDAPFSQVHGHSSPFNFQQDSWWPDATSLVRAATRVDKRIRRTVTLLTPSIKAIAIDWNLGDVPIDDVPSWPLLQLDCH
ncbi:hypothetical protein [Nakamurella antarctica]|uniref:hypothetical protein n=1 Tax=Nakamurella antarctica TaxID=1902245 RepID=UPI0030D13C02